MPYLTVDERVAAQGLDRPATSSLTFTRGAAALANCALVWVGIGNRSSIYPTAEAPVLLDLTVVSGLEPFSLRQGGAALRRVAS